MIENRRVNVNNVRAIQRRWVWLLIVFGLMSTNSAAAFAQFDRTLDEMLPLIEARVGKRKPGTLANREANRIAMGVELDDLPNYEIDEEILGNWYDFVQAFPTKAVLQDVPARSRAELDQTLRSRDHLIGGADDLRLGFHGGRLVYIYWEDIPSESSVPWNVTTYATPNGFGGTFSKAKVGFIDRHPSPLFQLTIARIRGGFSKWTTPPWQYVLFPSVGGVDRVVVDSFLGSSGNVSYYAANTYAYLRGYTLNRIVAIPEEGDCYWITELTTTRRSDKTGEELEAEHAYLIAPEAFWRMILAELADAQDDLKLDSVKKKTVPTLLTYTSSSYDGALSSIMSYEQLVASLSQRTAMAVFAALERPEVDANVVKDYGREGKTKYGELDPDLAAAQLAGLLTTVKATQATRSKVLEVLGWWKSKQAVPNLIKLLDFKVIGKVKVPDDELTALRAATAKTLAEITGKDFGQDATAWKNWLRESNK